jgi:hypothetical protein
VSYRKESNHAFGGVNANENEVCTRSKTCCSQREVANPDTEHAKKYADEPEDNCDGRIWGHCFNQNGHG